MTSNAEVLKGIFSNTLPSVLFQSHTPLQEAEQMAQKFSHHAITTASAQHHTQHCSTLLLRGSHICGRVTVGIHGGPRMTLTVIVNR